MSVRVCVERLRCFESSTGIIIILITIRKVTWARLLYLQGHFQNVICFCVQIKSTIFNRIDWTNPCHHMMKTFPMHFLYFRPDARVVKTLVNGKSAMKFIWFHHLTQLAQFAIGVWYAKYARNALTSVWLIFEELNYDWNKPLSHFHSNDFVITVESTMHKRFFAL